MAKIFTDGTAEFRIDKVIPYQLERNTEYDIGDIAYVMTLGAKKYLECTKGGYTSTEYIEIPNDAKTGSTYTDGAVTWVVKTSTNKEYVDNKIAEFFSNTSGELKGNAASATKLQTGRKITVTGNASGSTTFDGSSDVSLKLAVSKLRANGTSTSWVKGRDTALVSSTVAGNDQYIPVVTCKSLNGSWDIGTYIGNVLHFSYITDANYKANTDSQTADIQFGADGSINASKVYNAVYADYAEFFEKGKEKEEITAGDIIALDENSDKEEYIKADKNSSVIVGICSNEYAHIIGGKGKTIQENMKDYIPVSLCGRVHVKIEGKVRKGDRIVISDKHRGIGKARENTIEDNEKTVVGIALENKETDEIGMVRVLVKNSI